MDAKTLADRLTGREIGDEILPAEEQQARDACLLVIFGANDDLVEFRGAFDDEANAYGGGSVLFDRGGVIEAERDNRLSDDEMALYFHRKRSAFKVEAQWCREGEYSWTFVTDLPHETFEVVEDGAPYCRGIVLALPEEGAP